MRESDAYPQLYQESAGRKTRDKAINILQGRCVGGSTTVNWTSSFRTPPATLAYWAHEFGIEGFSPDDLAPWFERMEARLNIAPWPVAPNANNEALRRGAQALGIPAASIRRNVKGCWNIGYCGMGCPTNAKQSMLVTTIPAALERGATLLTRARAWTLRARWRAHHRAHLRGTGRARHRSHRAPHPRACQDLRRSGRRDRHAGAAPAQQAAGSARSGRQAHLPAPDRGIGGADAGARRRLRRRAADGLLGPFPGHAAARRPDRLQARGTAAASACSWRRRCRNSVSRTRAGCANCRTCRSSSRCCATDFIATAPAARSRCKATARPCSTIRSTTTSGTVRGGRCSRWRRFSSPPAPRP